jgi:hypothetical protein
VFGTVTGFTVALLFLFMAAQVMLGLYATSTLRAVLHDAATRAASDGATAPGDLDRIAREAEESMGGLGDHVSVHLSTVDVDGDGDPDLVVGQAVANPPRVLPTSIGGMVGFEEVQAGVSVRVERVR